MGAANCVAVSLRLLSLISLAGVQLMTTQCGAARAAAEAAPVILLTGFEPFGAGRPANPSWEGVRELDGRSWHGYRLVCREMKVDWGAPLVQLSQWVEDLRPVAVFSFGQGVPGTFAIETHARNERGSIVDNRGELPTSASITSDGPPEFKASIDATALAAALGSEGFPVRLSTNAGQYLCEEALYTLEYLKSRETITGSVVFCHVPPLGSRIDETVVDAAYVQRFVEALLAAWAESKALGKAVEASATTTLRQAVADPREAPVRELIDRYFRTWSAQDIDRYGQCFMPQAVVQLIDPAGRLVTMPLRQFLESQRESHRQAADPLTESPESVDVKFEGVLARVVVYWKLVAGERVEYGYDHFTLMPAGHEWRIANLIFYGTPEKVGEP